MLSDDIHIEVPRVEYEKLSDERLGEPSVAIRKRVEAARVRQAARFEGTRMLANADMGPGEVRDFCRLDDVPATLGLARACLARRASRRPCSNSKRVPGRTTAF
jgi:predicted ATPase with chaperone activity